MIEERKVTRHTAVCDNCGWRGIPRLGYRGHDYAVRELEHHKGQCGEHRATYASGSRHWAGGWRYECICNESWIVEDVWAEFKCPKDGS